MGEYIHYGSDHFYRECFDKIRNNPMFTKPFGGFWASPLYVEYGWKDWCEDEKFRECDEDNSFRFRLSKDARVLDIRDVKDLEGLPKIKETIYRGVMNWVFLDFEKLALKYDAIELHLSEERRVGLSPDSLYFKLYGWDCDSILIMNPDVVVEVSH